MLTIATVSIKVLIIRNAAPSDFGDEQGVVETFARDNDIYQLDNSADSVTTRQAIGDGYFSIMISWLKYGEKEVSHETANHKELYGVACIETTHSR